MMNTEKWNLEEAIATLTHYKATLRQAQANETGTELLIPKGVLRPHRDIVIGRLHRQLSLNEVYAHRHLNCSYYWYCVGKAAKARFESFSCLPCPKYSTFHLF